MKIGKSISGMIKKRNLLRLFAIRDDDVSYFTKWQELDCLYEKVYNNLPISFSVVPFAVPHRGKEAQSTELSKRLIPKPIHENQELVEYLRMMIRQDKAEIMLHGYSHKYIMKKNSRIGEYAWKSKEQLIKETIEAKKYLENLFHTTVKVFIPPSNMIGKYGTVAIEAAGLHLSGIIGRRLDRPISINYIKAYMRRWVYRCMKSRPYPFPLKIGKHIELVAYSLTPSTILSWIQDTMRTCYELGAPFVLSTHHWELIEHPDLSIALIQLIKEALSMGYIAARVSQCINSSADFY